MGMSTRSSRTGSREKLPSFSISKRRTSAKQSPVIKSPTTVLSRPGSPDSSNGFSSSSSSGEQNYHHHDPDIGSTNNIISRTKSPVCKSLACDQDTIRAETIFQQVDSQTWFASIDRPSDLLVEVDNVKFHLHKLPIISRSGLLYRLAARYNGSGKTYLNLDDAPGGAEAFLLVTKFCYGVLVELSPTNIAALRCAAEYLEMTDEFEEGNVISKAEAYLNLVILNSWQESIIVLQSCELLLPYAEDIQLVRRCSESVAHKAVTDPRGVRWLYSGSDCLVQATSKCFKIPLDGSDVKIAPKDWWYEDVSHLTFFCFGKVVAAIKKTGMRVDLLGGALEHYAQKWLQGVIKSSPVGPLSKGSSSSSPTKKLSPVSSPRNGANGTELVVAKRTGEDSPPKLSEYIAEQNRNRFLVEEIVNLLPHQKDAVSCSFLLRMLRAANMLNCSSSCRGDLERKAGLQLDQGSLSDLLIPSFCHTSDYLYDVDIVRRLLDHFLVLDQGVNSSPKHTLTDRRTGAVFDGTSVKKIPHAAPNARTKVGKLLDAYLTEVARDSKLPLGKFQSLAEALPENSRVHDDGLYTAIDTYMKIHPSLAEHERKRLCRVLDCQRLTLDACMHAAQNERLPLRVVVQVLFSEQLKLRTTISDISSSANEDHHRTEDVPNPREATTAAAPQSSAQVDAAVAHQLSLQECTNQMEIKALQRELATMRMKYKDMERDHSTMLEQVEKFTRTRGQSSSWSSGWKKIGKLQIFHHHKEIERVPSERRTNPRRWRNSIS